MRNKLLLVTVLIGYFLSYSVSQAQGEEIIAASGISNEILVELYSSESCPSCLTAQTSGLRGSCPIRIFGQNFGSASVTNPVEFATNKQIARKYAVVAQIEEVSRYIALQLTGASL